MFIVVSGPASVRTHSMTCCQHVARRPSIRSDAWTSCGLTRGYQEIPSHLTQWGLVDCDVRERLRCLWSECHPVNNAFVWVIVPVEPEHYVRFNTACVDERPCGIMNRTSGNRHSHLTVCLCPSVCGMYITHIYLRDFTAVISWTVSTVQC